MPRFSFVVRLCTHIQAIDIPDIEPYQSKNINKIRTGKFLLVEKSFFVQKKKFNDKKFFFYIEKVQTFEQFVDYYDFSSDNFLELKKH